MADLGYPRPDFERSTLRWQSLNGTWRLIFDDDNVGQEKRWQEQGLPLELSREIKVPFAFQTPASGVNAREVHEVIWYERTFSDIRNSKNGSEAERLLVRFGAVDYEAAVWVNGHFIGNHRGGHVPFDLDVTDALDAASPKQDQQRLTMRVYDSASDLTQPRGKQFWKPESESIFYAPTSGIWQNVWLEAVPQARLGDGSYGTILRANDIDKGQLYARVAVAGNILRSKLSIEAEVSFDGALVKKSERVEVKRDKMYADLAIDMKLPVDKLSQMPKAHDDKPGSLLNISKSGVALWSPKAPHLYDVVLRLYNGTDNKVDEVKTVVGMRSIEWVTDDRTWRLNGTPYFQMLVLDQGYWPETGLTPPSPVHLKKDIEISQALGFNGCRKHQKTEDPLFLYWADRLGYLVWGEMANAYEFDESYVDRFNQEWMDAVRRDINHPCVVTWTPGNESWGYPNLQENVSQRDHLRTLYYLTKTLDPTRPINDNCGWEHVCTDLTTFHDYSDGPELARACDSWDNILAPKGGHELFVKPLLNDPGSQPSPKAPIICTEFGGVNIKPSSASGGKDWGYTTASNSEDLLARIERLIHAIVDGGWVCGFVYTQLTDIEQEVNGLYTPDRAAKLDVTRMRGILQEAEQLYHQKRETRARLADAK